MSLEIVSSKDEVETFLKELKEILMSPNFFDVSRDLDILLVRFPFPVRLPYA